MKRPEDVQLSREEGEAVLARLEANTLTAGVEMRLDGTALLAAVRYEVEKFRCSACGQIFPAPLPIAAGSEKYTARARAVLALARYYLGVPLYRVESYQALVGVPLPDATQWDQLEHVGNEYAPADSSALVLDDCLWPVSPTPPCMLSSSQR